MVADSDEWDDAPHAGSDLPMEERTARGLWCGTWETTSSVDAERRAENSLLLVFSSSWRPEFDNNYHQTGIIDATSYTVTVRFGTNDGREVADSFTFTAEAEAITADLELVEVLSVEPPELTAGEALGRLECRIGNHGPDHFGYDGFEIPGYHGLARRKKAFSAVFVSRKYQLPLETSKPPFNGCHSLDTCEVCSRVKPANGYGQMRSSESFGCLLARSRGRVGTYDQVSYR